MVGVLVMVAVAVGVRVGVKVGRVPCTRKPRISPLGKILEWTFRYVCPLARQAASWFSAVAGVPPFAVMNAGL